MVEQIRDAILLAELKPGDRLPQDELAKRLNVSSTPVREALRQLEAEGVLDHVPHHGVRVAEIKFEDVREIYLIRGVLEALATQEAVPNLDPTDVAFLNALQLEAKAIIKEGQLKRLHKVNHDFHMRIYVAANMPELYRLIRSLWTKFPWDTHNVLPGRPIKSIEEHEKIIGAIEAGDAEMTSWLMHEHIKVSASSLMEFLAQQEAEVRTDKV